MSIVALAFVISTIVRQWTEFDPLGNFPVQRVLNPLPGDRVSPTVSVDDDVEVRAVKCVEADEPVRVLVDLHWQSVEPPGSVYEAGVSSVIRDPGCTATTYSNDIPDAVRRRVLVLHARGIESVWIIRGTETPVRPDGSRGVPQDWQTENFTLLAS